MTDLKALLTCAGCTEAAPLVTINGAPLCRGCALEVIELASPRKPRPPRSPADTEALAEQRAVMVVRALADRPLTFDELKTKIGGKSDLLMRSLEIAEAEEWIATRMNGARRAGYEITDHGRGLVGRSSREPVPVAPVMGFVASVLGQHATA